MAALDKLTAAVAKNTEVDASAIILLQGLKTKLDEAIAANDPAAVQKLSDDLAASTQALADAVAAHTVADPANPANPANGNGNSNGDGGDDGVVSDPSVDPLP